MFVVQSCDEPKPIKGLIGKSENDVRGKYGVPTDTSMFVLSDTLLEYRYGLLSIFPEYKEKEVKIKEEVWKGNNRTKVVWFALKDGKWEVVDNLQWGKNIRF